LRYFDITQWKLGKDVLNKDFHSMNISTVSSEPATAAFYKRTAYEKRTFKDNFYLFPIPFDEINKSKSLVQNPGW
ncbi:MAG TPA: RagB/SusD family nutrient uptake outer membrane protein, partial [Bacteroidales bacterium]|nr:RagB/SusD family nutrient uptake outer membrane protein [Bacteroidales bacterium]